MRLPALLVALHCALAGAQDRLTVVFDPRPDPGLPVEARSAGTRPSGDTSSRNLSIGLVTELKDLGAIRNLIPPKDIHAIRVRYYGESFKSRADVERYLASMLASQKGHTHAHIPWAEGLAVPDVEASVQFSSGRTGRWLLW